MKKASRSRSKTPKGSRKVTIAEKETVPYSQDAPVTSLQARITSARKALKQELKKRRQQGNLSEKEGKEATRSPTPHPSRGSQRQLPPETKQEPEVVLSPRKERKRPSKANWWKGWKGQKDHWRNQSQSSGKSSKKGKGKGKKKTGSW